MTRCSSVIRADIIPSRPMNTICTSADISSLPSKRVLVRVCVEPCLRSFSHRIVQQPSSPPSPRLNVSALRYSHVESEMDDDEDDDDERHLNIDETKKPNITMDDDNDERSSDNEHVRK